MIYEDERATIISVCKLMQSIGFFLGTWGNISMRLNNHILLTPSKVNYDTMKPEDMVVINMSGDIVEGNRNPTSEKEVHRQIYLLRDDVKAIIHAHTPKAMAVAASSAKEVPCLVEEMSQLLGGSIPITFAYVPAQEHEKLGMAAAESIGEKNGVILKNHGPVACGRTMDEAILVSKVIEKACGIYLDITDKNDMQKISDCYIRSERHRYLYSYGKERT
ncbi:aldolase [Vallitalea longa]|uniref:Aldolase n=1 Tax=Vallitalea longa TaxID=2936439 RepID=A0A9W5Y740_9FIRM|nr:class II aldolase/adducin family protein [Vallitalea longa]GKX27667.1 aldolase [Vallitalea longa]